MHFNSFVYTYTSLSGILAVFLYFIGEKISKQRSAGGQRFRASFGAENAEFRAFRRRFMFGYLPCLFADSLQAPYLYYLYQSYGFLESQIAVLYICGYATSITFAVAGVYLLQRVDRRLLCLIFVALNSISCLMKFVDIYTVLLLSRVIDGIASSLLVTPFQEWYVHEHVSTHDFPKEWIPVTFRRVALVNGVLSVAAGFVAELSESAFRVTAFPFLMAIPVLLAAGFYMHTGWSSNRVQLSGERTRLTSQLGRALRVILREPNVLLLSTVQSCFEACIFMFIFAWTPLFMRLKSTMTVRPCFGGIYSCLMCSVLLGSLLQRLLVRKSSAAQLLCFASALATCAMCLAAWMLNAVTSSASTTTVSNSEHAEERRQSLQANFAILLAIFGVYQISVGVYFPCMQRLHRQVLASTTDEHSRPMVLACFRIPMHLLAALGLILIVHASAPGQGNVMMLMMCVMLLCVCLLTSILLARSLSATETAARAVNQLSVQLANSDDEDVFS